MMGFSGKLARWVALVLAICAFAGMGLADSINISAGHAHYASLVSEMNTLSWGGIIVTQELSPLSSRLEPFMELSIESPDTMQIDFPGYNFNDGNHYYMAAQVDNFDLNLIRNMTASDLRESMLFGSSNFPQFYPNYNVRNDNPNKTFCCNQELLEVAGVNFTAYKITLANGIDYYILKYGDGVGTPLFFSPIKDESCFDNTSCVSEFMLPLSRSPYYFYGINKQDYYVYNITIDGVYTRHFTQTALPYKLWVKVYNALTLQPAPNISVVIGEEYGQNIFIPYRMEGYISHSYSVGYNDENGTEEFLVAPTVYPSIANYTIYVGVLRDGEIMSQDELYVDSRDSLIQVSKPLQPSMLYDNAKVSINAMNQINSYLFRWSSQVLQARRFTVAYEMTTHNFTISEVGKAGPRNLTLKTGAPNVILVTVINGGMPVYNYLVQIKEQGGYLILDPYTSDSPFRPKTRVEMQTIPTLTEFVVTPTSLGVIQSNISLDIITSNGSILASAPVHVESSLDMSAGGSYYNNDLMKTIVNAMNAVLYSLFYSLNN